MSADLLAAFGDSEVSDAQEKPSSQPASNKQHHSAPSLAVAEDTWQPWPGVAASTPKVNQPIAKIPSPLWQRDQGGADVLFDAENDQGVDEDDFGDFEEAENANASSSVAAGSAQPHSNVVPAPSWQAEPRQTAASNIEQPSSDMNLLGLDDEPPTQQLAGLGVYDAKPKSDDLFSGFNNSAHKDFTPNPPERTGRPIKSVEQLPIDDGLDDDWGTFEEAESGREVPLGQDYMQKPPSQEPSAQELDIWDFSAFATPTMDQNKQTAPVQSQSHSHLQQLSSPVREPRQPPGILASPLRNQAKPTTKPSQQPQEAEDDEWDDFDAIQPSFTSVAPNATSSTPNIATAKSPIPATTPSRPTNIPPPSTLLQLLPRVFSQLASQASSSSSSASTEPSEVARLVLYSYIVTSRLLSGRSLRWKRDTVLAQSMSISGSTASGGGRGMKLTTLDKGESRKEDQEAELAVAAWTKYAYILNTAMNKAKIQKPAMSLSASSMKVKTETGLGVVSANHVCPICGLKRNERVIGIDTKVDDTFGDFWVEHWGHKDCFDFWYRYKDMLIQR